MGVEIELAGLDVPAAAAVVAAVVGGCTEAISRYEYRIIGDARGEWVVELDFAYLKGRGRGPTESVTGEAMETVIRLGAEQVVPVEVVSPPLRLRDLAVADEVIGALREGGARGTGGGLVYAFGLQLNPEMPALDPETITRYLRAFLCLFDWLKERARVDLTRRLTTYIDPFPRAYVRRVVDPGYRPSLEQLIDDYLAANPTRNRALDLLPLFTHLDPGRVRAALDDPRIKARPALHYRLPNSEVDRPGWGIGGAWNDWVCVERLACDEVRLRSVAAAYVDHLDHPLQALGHPWLEQVTEWLDADDGL
ncbi:MAG: amidoligase family protein [Arhodomonas sp.]|nr:amidoligase family protein [Arhodomonas sp.]